MNLKFVKLSLFQAIENGRINLFLKKYMETNILNTLVALFAAVNLVAFLIMLWDKNRSRNRNNKRISEGMLFFMATCFGSIGVYIGMFAFRHKTRKWYFIIGIPLLIVQNLTFLYLIFQLLGVY